MGDIIIELDELLKEDKKYNVSDQKRLHASQCGVKCYNYSSLAQELMKSVSVAKERSVKDASLDESHSKHIQDQIQNMNSAPEQDSIPFDPQKHFYDTPCPACDHTIVMPLISNSIIDEMNEKKRRSLDREKQNELHLANQQLQNHVLQRQSCSNLDVIATKATVLIIHQDMDV
eukprot:6807566-Ditylum_brightwellii.AAC.1